MPKPPKINSQKEIAIVHEICVEVHHTICPHCGTEQVGWLDNPRNKTSTCDDCGGHYTVASDAEFVHV